MPLQALLESFFNGQISVGQLLHAIDGMPPTDADAALRALQAAGQDARLPDAVYAQLIERLRLAAAGQDDEHTRIAGRAGTAEAADADATIVANAQDNDATVIARTMYKGATAAKTQDDAATAVATSRDNGASATQNPQAEETLLTAAAATIALATPAARPVDEMATIQSSQEQPTSLQTGRTGQTRGTVKLTTLATGKIAQDILDTFAEENLTLSSELPPGHELSVGVVLKERFVLQDVLGQGGMGSVFKALDLRKVEANDREPFVALKVLNQDFRQDPVSLIALQRETKRAQTLSHPNIITVYDFDRDGPYVFMTMELLQGRPLNSLIRGLPEGGMPFKKAWPLIEGMGAALAYAHKKNIVHSDFKPGNVFVTPQNEAKVLDFGIATAIGRPEKGDATVFNARDLGAMTPAYASLEQQRFQPPDARDDIYALACVAYELLTGKHPFGKLPAEQAMELKLQPQPVPGLKRNQWKALQRGLAFKQQDRIGSVAEFIKLLQPRSKLFYGAWTAAMLAMAVTGTNVYLNIIAPPPAPPPIAVELTPAQQHKVNDLLELAAIHFEVGYLTAPTGSNALWAYQEVLKIDPYNEKAIEGLKKIADAELQAAWESYEKGDRADSLKKVMDGLEADPRHEGLLKLKAKLES